MKKTNKQTVTKEDIEALKNMIMDALIAQGQQEHVAMMPDDLRKRIYTDEEFAQIKKDTDEKRQKMWMNFYGTFRKLGCEI